MTIIKHLGVKYAISHHITDVIGMAANVKTPACNEAAYMQTPCNRATTRTSFLQTIST